MFCMTDVTRILNAIEQGDPSASEELLPLVYEELRVLARQRLANEKPGQTLQATALVHEAYLRLVGKENDQCWDNRGHFFAAAAEAMRRILVDRARNKRRVKRGGEVRRIDVSKVEFAIDSPDEDVLAIDDALDRMSQEYPECAELIKLRFFAGLSLAEAARTLDLAPRSADRAWAFGRAWLYRELAS
jgi:RNA polymerase sigma factor (TIGR02999 family)